MMTFANPNVWGSSGWVLMHCIANTYPESPTPAEKTHYFRFFDSLKNVLPCKLCRKHYNEWLEMFPIRKYLGSRQQLKDWVFRLHNYVNQRLQKKLVPSCESSDKTIMKFAIKNQAFKK
jgi:FAD-linked sulfhydryl oxidase